MRIAIIGAAGKAGGIIAAEAKSRGHEVTAIVSPSDDSTPGGKDAVITKDLFALSADDLRGFDAVVNAFGTPLDKPGNEYLPADATRHLLTVFEELPETRLLFVGGAGSLNKTPGKEQRLLEDIRKSNVNWTFFNPSVHFDDDGLRTGKYTLGGDFQILNSVGASYISTADYAVAMVDEIENNAHPREQFTAVSSDPFFREATQFYSVKEHMFSRRGAWLALQADSASYGIGALYLMSNRGSRKSSADPNFNKLYRLYPTFNGNRVPFAIQTAAAEFTLHTHHGDVRFTWADKRRLMAEGDTGMGLLFIHKGENYELVKPRRDDSWESPLRNTGSLLFKGLEGSKFAFENTWNWYGNNYGEMKGSTHPNAEDKMTLIVEEFPYAAHTRDGYPTYAQAKTSMKEEWEAFLAKMPHYIQPFELKREECAYVLWSHLVAPNQLTPNEMIMMFPGEMASEWQLVQNGVALQEHMELSIDLLLAPFNRQGEEGQIAESYDENHLSSNSVKPPIYGWALKNIMKHHDIAKEWPRDKIEKLYVGAGRWADWFMNCRDEDGDGLPSFYGGTENGFDEVTLFIDQLNIATPDVSAYLVLAFEAQGDLAKLLGKPKEEADAWYNKSKGLLQRMIDALWDGEHFVGLKEYTHEPVFTGSLAHYIPFVLGARLPQKIIDKMARDLSEEGGLLSRYGLATERMIDSDYFSVQGLQMGCGAIDPPAELFICTGIWDAGKKDLARTIIERYCNRLMDRGFSHIIDPISGNGSPFWGTWSRCVFTILCRMISED